MTSLTFKKYKIYCDGAFSPSRNTGGIAFVIFNEEDKIVCEFFKKFHNTTNQRMEQLAVAIALDCIKSISIFLASSTSRIIPWWRPSTF